jgi:hypothetical protein
MLWGYMNISHKESAFIDWYRTLTTDEKDCVYDAVVIRGEELPPAFEHGGCVPEQFGRLARPQSFDDVLFIRR